jgi:branched-chain amino acid transport system substrate-binding protein
VELPPRAADLARAAHDVRATGASVVLVIAPGRDAARLVKALRAAGFEGAIVGGPTLGRSSFLREAGEHAEGVLLPLLFDVEGAPGDFVSAYRQRFGGDPDWLAAHAYDAVRLAAEAVREAGLNRVRIHDALKGLVPWEGVTGRVVWDATGRALREVRPGTIRHGRVVPVGDMTERR